MTPNTLKEDETHHLNEAERLELLLTLLQSLPLSLPTPNPSAYYFEPDDQDIKDESYEMAVNRALENSIGLQALGLRFHERGKGIECVVPILCYALQHHCPRSAILYKWIDDLIRAVAKTNRNACVLALEASNILQQSDNQYIEISDGEGDSKLEARPSKPQTTQKKMVLPATFGMQHTPVTLNERSLSLANELEEFKVDPTYVDTHYNDMGEEEIDQSKGGAKPDQRIINITVPCFQVEDTNHKKKLVCCLASR
ncbi:hypothetical protein FRB94_010823 [Tulasnella sp. JGI-2019a]|nr:hypothetical protein FRB93_009776 [Tulasnella sp. JGI-2019a]KAG8993369.1 hypothetical protein FRB94_010823 [Tulasnella sp. JGI-2019a]KAG9024789.1 hypothetical protein FRB95_011061 [Tulasnella sp. JGI-2019a]